MMYLMGNSPRKERAHTEKDKKNSDPGGIRTQRPTEKFAVALPTERQGQMGAGCGYLRWKLLFK